MRVPEGLGEFSDPTHRATTGSLHRAPPRSARTRMGIGTHACSVQEHSKGRGVMELTAMRPSSRLNPRWEALLRAHDSGSANSGSWAA